MPLTPFIGLSVVIHLFIIITKKAFPNAKPLKPHVYYYDTVSRGMRLATVSIITTVFAFVILNASILVHASLVDSHSSIHIAERYFANNKEAALAYSANMNSVPRENVASSTPAILTSDEKIIPKSPPINCENILSTVQDKYGGSVVNFLYFNNFDSSLEHRMDLARKFGISNYDGDDYQNILLLLRLYEQHEGLSPGSTKMCLPN